MMKKPNSMLLNRGDFGRAKMRFEEDAERAVRVRADVPLPLLHGQTKQ
jgi:hypothetical protein